MTTSVCPSFATQRPLDHLLTPPPPTDYVCCLPVPDKAARQWNFCIFPASSDGLSGSTADALVFTIPDGAPKTASGDMLGAGHDTSTYRSLLVDLFNAVLKPSKARISAVEEPKEAVFFSTIPQSHRKGEKAFHIKAHRGSKEGLPLLTHPHRYAPMLTSGE